MKEISIKDIPGIQIGNAQNENGGTGCTVLLSEKGFSAGIDVRGGGAASRETELLNPIATASIIHGIVLAGGSAFGLDCAGGVMKYMEERGIGFDVGVTKVPLVCQSDLFDLTVGDPFIRPDASMGYTACENAMIGNYQDGNYGAGTGATVGKYSGMSYAMKSGIGSYAVQIGELKVGAIVAVNALGDIYDWKTGQKIAGMYDASSGHFISSAEIMYQKYDVVENKFTGNTTIGVIITNAAFDKTKLTKIAGMAQNGYARAIRPVHTSADGDTIYAISTGSVAADWDMVGSLAADVMSEAIKKAIIHAPSAYGYIGYQDMQTIR